jgi:uncharacterized protein
MPEVTQETRFFKGIEIREAAKDAVGTIGTISGYAAVFNSRSEVMWDFVEIIKPGAFARSLKDGADVRALAHHEGQQIIGRRSANTLRISEDDKGLKVEIDLPDTQAGRDTLTSVKRGDLTGMSFGFETMKDNWYRDQAPPGLLVRELMDVNIHEVSVVTWPAYTATSVEARSLEALVKQQRSKIPQPIDPAAMAKRDALIRRTKLICGIYG